MEREGEGGGRGYDGVRASSTRRSTSGRTVDGADGW